MGYYKPLRGSFLICHAFHRNAWNTRSTLERISVDYQQLTFIKNKPWNTFIADNQQLKYFKICHFYHKKQQIWPCHQPGPTNNYLQVIARQMTLRILKFAYFANYHQFYKKHFRTFGLPDSPD